MRRLGHFVITQVTGAEVVQLENSQGWPHGGLINGSRLKLYKEGPLPFL